MVSLAFFVLAVALRDRIPALFAVGLVVMTALTLLTPISESRRALIFTAGAVACRPFFGKPRMGALQKIKGLRRVMTSLTGKDVRRGIAFDFPDGSTEMWPLKFNAQSEMMERLSAVTGKPVTGEWSRWFG